MPQPTELSGRLTITLSEDTREILLQLTSDEHVIVVPLPPDQAIEISFQLFNGCVRLGYDVSEFFKGPTIN